MSQVRESSDLVSMLYYTRTHTHTHTNTHMYTRTKTHTHVHRLIMYLVVAMYLIIGNDMKMMFKFCT